MATSVVVQELSKCSGKCDDCKCKRPGPVADNRSGIEWYAPTSLAQLYAILAKHQQHNVKLISGNTGKGVFKQEGPFQAMVDINGVKELHCTTEVSSHLVVGGSLSLNAFIKLCESKTSKSSSFGAMAKHLRVVANTPVRNVGTLAGNLMLAHAHKDFPSDVVTMFEANGASLLIGGPVLSQVSLKEFKTMDMKGKVIVAIASPFLPDNVFVNTFKITPRSQNAHAYVNAGFAIPVDKTSMTVASRPRIVYGGITYNFFRAENTEKFLVGKTLTNADTLKGALEILDKEIIPEPKLIAHNGSTVAYHKDLALTLFYKAYIGALGDLAPERLRSAAKSILQEREVSRGERSYDVKPDFYPIGNPMTKIAAKLQAAGEAEYVNDIPSQEGEVYGALVLSTKANCVLDTIDPSEALAIPGVVSYFDAKDVPEGGKNECTFLNFFPDEVEGVFCRGKVMYIGHCIGVIIADTQKLADQAAKMVKVTYKDCKPPILTFEQAIEAKSFAPSFPPPWDEAVKDIDTGDVQGAMTSSPHVITGQVECGGQHHFHMETQVCLTIPKEDGLTLYSACQAITFVQKQVSEFLNVPNSSVDVIVKRIGGAFGGKAIRALQVASISALAAKQLDRPVRIKVNFNSNLLLQGGRSPHMAKYKVAVDNDGTLQAIDMDYYADTGCFPEDSDILDVSAHIDNLYYCPNWKVKFTTCLTNKASNTFCRAPGSAQSVFVMESIMDHVAKALNKSSEKIREKNLYEEGQKTPRGNPIPYCSIRKVWKDILETSEFKKRQAEIDEFNKANRWRKRGLALIPGKYNLVKMFSNFTVFVAIFAADGTVAIQHGGVEMGQGINVKVAQAAAYVLGIPMDVIVVKSNHTTFSPNTGVTAGSVGSEMCCKGAMECCKELNERFKPIRDANPGVHWKQLITICKYQGVDLSAKYEVKGLPEDDYVAYGVTCAEAEVDLLTGERLILRSDILYDCGESLNPAIDIGQIEGGFVFGMGYWLSEKVYFDQETGEQLSHGTWTYKPPTSKDIPVDLRVSLLKDAPNPIGVLGSKGSGEPPCTMSCSCLFAIKRAIEEGRKESGNDVHFSLNGPATVEVTHQSCLVDKSQLLIF